MALVTYVIAVLVWVMVIGRWLPMLGGTMEMQMADPEVLEAMALSNGMTGISHYLVMGV